MPTVGRWGDRQNATVVNDMRAETAEQLRRVIAWEMAAQTEMQREVSDMPLLIADTLLDFFEVTLRPEVDLPALD